MENMASQVRMRSATFLTTSFLSAVGDAVLVFAVPVGLGLETGDLRSAVLMWLIPAVAMFSSSFLSRHIGQRYRSARSDYAKLLLGIAVLELIISIAAFFFHGPLQTVALITGFVFFYALAKEGVPRILYLVAVYRYFVEPKDYTKIAGFSNGLNIFAGFLGTLLAGILVAHGSWRIALLLDALTFVGFGLAILYFGIDPACEEPTSDGSDTPVTISEKTVKALSVIQIMVPILFGMNALVWNYLPLLNEKFSVLSSSSSIFAIGFLRMPGLIAGLFIGVISKKVSLERLVLWIPAIFFGFTLAFVLSPSLSVFCGLTLAQGILSGLYWPSDFSIRNRLPAAVLIRFNTGVLRRLAATQFVSCLLALWLLSPSGPGLEAMPGCVILLIGGSIMLHAFSQIQLRPALTAMLLSGIVLLTGTGLSGCQSGKSDTVVILPSVSKNLELRPELTYAATIILNDTSAHFLRVSSDLTVQGQVLARFSSLRGGSQYQLELDPNYRSSRNEAITAQDVLYSIQYYLSQKRDLAGALTSIQGADSCQKVTCPISGIRIESEHKLLVTLKEPDLRWIEKLASPWLILIKSGKPVLETVGDCMLPYQTGPALVDRCDASGVHLKIHEKAALITDHLVGRNAKGGVSTLLTENPSETASPTLTVLAAFANPESKRLTAKARIAIMAAIRTRAQETARRVKLKWAPLLTPEWLGISAPDDLAHRPAEGAKSCPKGPPIKILLDTSLPNLSALRDELEKAIGCPLEFAVTHADTYFQEFAHADIGVAWFTPDFLDLYNIFAPFDCSVGNSCNFNWKDRAVQRRIDQIKRGSFSGEKNSATAIEIERIFLNKGYVAPLAEMNWWIRDVNGRVTPIHPAGLFQVRASDFL